MIELETERLFLRKLKAMIEFVEEKIEPCSRFKPELVTVNYYIKQR